MSLYFASYFHTFANPPGHSYSHVNLKVFFKGTKVQGLSDIRSFPFFKDHKWISLPCRKYAFPLKEIRFCRHLLYIHRTHTFPFPPCPRRGHPDSPLRTNQGKNSLEIPRSSSGPSLQELGVLALIPPPSACILRRRPRPTNALISPPLA